MQKTIDEIMAGVLVVLSDFQFHNQLYIAISLFINQILLLMYDGIDDFCVSLLLYLIILLIMKMKKFNSEIIVAIIEPRNLRRQETSARYEYCIKYNQYYE